MGNHNSTHEARARLKAKHSKTQSLPAILNKIGDDSVNTNININANTNPNTNNKETPIIRNQKLNTKTNFDEKSRKRNYSEHTQNTNKSKNNNKTLIQNDYQSLNQSFVKQNILQLMR